jgi:hypothetical protein
LSLFSGNIRFMFCAVFASRLIFPCCSTQSTYIPKDRFCIQLEIGSS